MTDGQLLERFLARNAPETSEAAFATLVDRHAAMVLAVCRNVLGNTHDAHDAFQATFLVLVNKAGSIRRRESVGGWLVGIAPRVAAPARLEGAPGAAVSNNWGPSVRASRMIEKDRSLPIPSPTSLR